jgi:hypothetical protein
VLPERLADELSGRGLVPPALDQDLQHLALVVDRAPEVHPLAGNANDHFIEVPAPAGPWARLPKVPRDRRPEITAHGVALRAQHPTSDRLIGDIQPRLGQKLLGPSGNAARRCLPLAQREPEKSHTACWMTADGNG